MLAVGRQRAAAAGLANLEFVEAGADELAFSEAGFDAVLSRQGLQFLPDVATTLARLRSFLVPGGRLAAAVWGPPAQVQFAAPVPIIRAELALAPPPAGIPGPFALADPGRLAALAEAAGFAEVATGAMTAIYRFASPEQATRGCVTSPRPSPPWSPASPRGPGARLGPGQRRLGALHHPRRPGPPRQPGPLGGRPAGLSRARCRLHG
jgi:SAM-dependent methyltransferase